ncbi:MAG: ECF transporter S component [Elusimicrobiota bacterium]|jgi:niacin transporter|nr:ECF transporter S component [Elusimicrobiota bacterium]
MENIIALASNTKVLNYKTPRAALMQTGLLAAALVLPSFCHYLSLPVAALVPMHWPVLLAGLVYGWRSGLMLGLAAPLISFLISGMPAGVMLPVMLCELSAYGFFAGICREKLRFNFFPSVVCALVAGKVFYVLAMLAAANTFSLAFLQTGIFAFVAQIVFLPAAAAGWTNSK